MDDITPQYTPAPIPSAVANISRGKKIVLIAGIALVVILILALVYFLVFRKPTQVTQPGETFPIGGNLQTSEQPINNAGLGSEKTNTGGEGEVALQKLIELYKGPVAGYALLADGRTIRLFDRMLGRLVQINVNNGETRTMSDQPILSTHDATFLGNNKIILRALGDTGVIKSTLYTITETTNENAPLVLDKPVALADDVLEVAQNSDGSKAVLIIKDPLGANIDVLDTSSQTLSRKGTLPLSEWIPSITDDGIIYLSSKASRFAPSGTYKLLNKKLVTSIPAGTAQTTSISPNGAIAYSSGTYGGKFSAELRDTNILSQAESADIPFVTLAEKCTWSKEGNALYCGVPKTRGENFPDDWYLGVNSFADTLHKYNLDTGTDEFIFSPEKYKVQLDMVNILPTANVIFLKNKKDEHLWLYRLTAQTASSSVNTGGTPTQENI